MVRIISKEQALEWLKRSEKDDDLLSPREWILMAKGVDGDEEQWTEVGFDDVENVEDGTYHDLQLWPRSSDSKGDSQAQRTFTSFDELVGVLAEENQVCDNDSWDDLVSFEMPDGRPVKRWVAVNDGPGKVRVIVSDTEA